MRHVGAAKVTRENAMVARRYGVKMPHLTPSGRRCHIGHSLDKPCPRWRGRNYP